MNKETATLIGIILLINGAFAGLFMMMSGSPVVYQTVEQVSIIELIEKHQAEIKRLENQLEDEQIYSDKVWEYVNHLEGQVSDEFACEGMVQVFGESDRWNYTKCND